MRPKFNIPKLDLKISSLRLDTTAGRDHHPHHASSPESRPPTPKSVRPPMAHDIEAELRAACSYIVTHPKPSHEVWAQDAARPALDYAAIRAAEPAPAPAPALTALPVRKQSLRAKVEARLEAVMHETAVPSSKYSYRPNLHTDELIRHEDITVLPNTARTRADLLMAPEPRRHASSSTGTHSESHSHSSSQQQATIPAQTEPVARARTSARSDSVGTTGSTPHSGSTDYPWSTSTGITSAVNTPARSSKRASSQIVTSESGSVPKLETVNAEWMKQELERHRKTIELREQERERLLEEQRSLERMGKENASMRTISHPLAAMSRVPPRKPVPSRPDSRQASDASRTSIRQDSRSDHSSLAAKGRGRADSGRTEQSQQTMDQEPRGRIPQRSNSRIRNASQTARRAVSRAGSITNEILGHYRRPDSRAAAQRPASPTSRHRSLSRTRHIANNVKDYFRSSSRKRSTDPARGHVRNQSIDSFHSASSERPGSEAAHKPWKGWRLHNKIIAHMGPETAASGKGAGDPPSAQKPAIDLNRELPPLPSLDSYWKHEPEEEPTEKSNSAASMTAAMAPAYHGLKRALSRRDLGSKPAQPSVDARRLNLHHASDNSVPNPPLMSSGNGPSWDEPDLHFLSMANLSTTKSAEPRAKIPLDNAGHSRLWSKIGLTNGPEVSRPPLPRNTSQQLGPDHDSEMPAVVLTGNPNLVYHSRAVVAGLVDDPARVPSPNMSGSMGLSRQNSDRVDANRKPSTGEYARMMDPHYQNMVETQEKQAVDLERFRRHWWKRQDQQQPSCVDQIIRSGAKKGSL